MIGLPCFVVVIDDVTGKPCGNGGTKIIIDLVDILVQLFFYEMFVVVVKRRDHCFTLTYKRVTLMLTFPRSKKLILSKAKRRRE